MFRTLTPKTALHRITQRPYGNRADSLDIIRLLFERGTDINRRDKLGWTPLHEAASHGAWEEIKLLIELGADINAQIAGPGTGSETPLDIVYSMHFLGGPTIANWMKTKGGQKGVTH